MLFSFLSFLLVFSAILVISAQNPVHSVFFLVLVFFTSAFLLFLLEVEFVSLLFVLVYVGAIAVLFLFVVMMLDIKITKYEKDLLFYIPIGGFLGVIFFLEVFLSLQENLVPFLPSSGREIYTDWLSVIDSLTNLNVLGQILYTYYFFYFLIAGIILLLAMVGAIVLTLNFTQKAKHQFVFRQILREKKNSMYLVK
uniref:NADH-ubiquinone oxidoreductase chain 6 n=1 Tax=Trachydiscus minutus TaxID=1032745 RepID=A0A140F2R1_9STRA|nr:NADH dehydrogenase subunit 6 [Trachydiscus minutus]AML60695.1 NADH dehydrogenase subunit 6 [Trachydiscus minutus]